MPEPEPELDLEPETILSSTLVLHIQLLLLVLYISNQVIISYLKYGCNIFVCASCKMRVRKLCYKKSKPEEPGTACSVLHARN